MTFTTIKKQTLELSDEEREILKETVDILREIHDYDNTYELFNICVDESGFSMEHFYDLSSLLMVLVENDSIGFECDE